MPKTIFEAEVVVMKGDKPQFAYVVGPDAECANLSVGVVDLEKRARKAGESSGAAIRMTSYELEETAERARACRGRDVYVQEDLR
jgi:hypothetical protein